MAKIINDKAQIRQWQRDKQQNEQELATELYGFFNTTLIQYARDTAGAALDVMFDGAEPTIREAVNEEKGLAVYGRRAPGVADTGRLRIGQMRRNLGQFDASDCSDIIRLFGAWVEKGGMLGPGAVRTLPYSGGMETSQRTGTDWDEMTVSSSIKDAFRGGIQTGTGNWKQEVESVWGDKKDRFRDVDTARRDRAGRAGLPDHIIPNPESTFTGMGGLVGNSNVQGKIATRDSNTLKVDKIFGLLAGADISGTTADTVFALEVLSGLKGLELSPIMYMLPLATIVYNCHHTLLEVALPLTLNGALEYRLGFYTTLLPFTSGHKGGTAEIREILKKYENSLKNRHFMCWYQGADAHGAIIFDRPWEKNILKQQDLSLAKKVLASSMSLPVNPGIKDVLGMVKYLAPGLVLALGKHGSS